MQYQTQLDQESSPAIVLNLFDRAIVLLTHENNQLIECSITCEIPLEIYQAIEQQELLNLKPEFHNQSISFSTETDITLKATLHPERHSDLAEHTTPEAVLEYLQQLRQTQPEHSLLNLDNWFLLSAYQGDRGYTTLWATLNPSKLAAGQIPEAELTESLSQFFVNVAETELTKAAEQFGQSLLDDLTNLFNQESNPTSNPSRKAASDRTIANTMIALFTNDDWTFTKIKGEPMLQMGYQGKNGQWICYTRANEDPQQFIFYSIYPTVVPEERKSAIVEFMTRANCGMVIGNFEFNFSNGEIFYKTSIDVEGDRLTSALIQRLVYTNVAIMDNYLPGIIAVLDEQATPEAALAQVEAQDSSSDPTTP